MSHPNPFYQLPAGAMVSGPAEALIEAFFPSRYDGHVQAWRWYEHCKDDERRYDAMCAELQKMLEERAHG